jgi:ABC-type uncharacterized transport system ATPase subunit
MIETRGLRKVYRTKKRRQVTMVDAVRGIDLTVAEGEIFGFLGPNGAGKTTTLRMLPIAFAPLWLKRVADWNPFYLATSAMRALFANHLGENVVWEGAIVVAALTALGRAWSTRLIARSLR